MEDPLINKKFPRYNTIGDEETAANKVLESGILSGFIGAKGDGFNGGQEIQNLEKELASYFNVNHCIA